MTDAVSADHARKSLRVLDLSLEADEYVPVALGESETQVPNKTATEINKDGTQSSSKIIEMSEEDSKDSRFLLEAHGYNVGLWELVSAKSSIWQAHCKGGETKTLYSSKITVKPIHNGIDFDDVIENLVRFSDSYGSKNITPQQYEYGAEVLIPCFFDVHFGKLASTDECGEKYDFKIAKQRMLDSVQKYIDRLQGRKFEKIIFAIGNDYFNSEPDGNTVNSTRQDNDSRYSKMFNKGVETLIEAIDMFSNVAPVEVVLVQGNHAFYTEFYASCVLNAWYRNSDIVTVNDSPTVRKYIKFGNNLIGFTHGSEERDRIYGLMQHEAAADWGTTTTREWLIGHLHSEGVVEKNGVVVRRVPSLCGSDAWHVKSGFTTSRKRTMAFVYDKEDGLVETLYVNIK